jgi:hypothetical protein
MDIKFKFILRIKVLNIINYLFLDMKRYILIQLNDIIDSYNKKYLVEHY